MHPVTLEAESRLGRAYHWLGRRSEAIELLKKTCSARDKVLGPERGYTRTTRRLLAKCYMDVGAFELAEEQLEIVRSARETHGRGSSQTLRLLGLCKVKRKDKEWDKAEELFRTILKDDDSKDEADKMTPWLRYMTQIRLGQALTGQYRFGEAQIELDAGLKGLRNPDVSREITFDLSYDDPIRVALQAQIDLCDASKKPEEEARKWRQQLKEREKLLTEREAK